MSSNRRSLFSGPIALLAAATMAAPACAQARFADEPAAKAYQSCIALARNDPENGFEAAIAWRDEGGGAAARHCTAIALVNLGQYADAALRLETLAREMNGFGAAERAAVLGQSGRVWRRSGNLDRARATLAAAVDLDPANAELRIDRGEISAAAGRYWEAIDDFNAALELSPGDVDALVFRAAAYRLLDVAELAREDLVAALARDADNPEALVELGAVELLDSRHVAARAHWLRAIDIAPASSAADAARRWLEKLDVNIR